MRRPYNQRLDECGVDLEPEQSCPAIDHAVKKLRSMIQDLNAARGKTEDDAARDSMAEAVIDAEAAIETLEEVRAINDALRRWGYAWRREASDFADEIDVLGVRV